MCIANTFSANLLCVFSAYAVCVLRMVCASRLGSHYLFNEPGACAFYICFVRVRDLRTVCVFFCAIAIALLTYQSRVICACVLRIVCVPFLCISNTVSVNVLCVFFCICGVRVFVRFAYGWCIMVVCFPLPSQ